jgi:hypothetical protein
MGRGGYSGPTAGLGLVGCLLLVLPYLFGVGFIIEDFGYGGAPGWQFSLALIVWSALAFVLAVAISFLVKRLRQR